MTRITDRDRYFMKMALHTATASKCVRAQYGTVIVTNDGRVASTGFNGKPRGSRNDDVCYREGLPPSAPKENCCLHSEANAIMFSSPEERRGATIYVSGVPCRDCSLLIMQSGVTRLVYLDAGMHVDPTMDEFWEKYGHTWFGATGGIGVQRVAMKPEEL